MPTLCRAIACGLFTLSSVALGAGLVLGAPAAAPKLVCPVMKAEIKDPAKAPQMKVNNVPVHFCCAGCDAVLRKEPVKYVKTTKDPVTGKAFKVTAKTPKVERPGALFLFSSAKTKATFDKNPAKYSK